MCLCVRYKATSTVSGAPITRLTGIDLDDVDEL